jgi:hypothetical protein
MVGKGQDSALRSGMIGKPVMYRTVHGKMVRDSTNIDLLGPDGWTNYAPWFSDYKILTLAYNIDSLNRRLDSLQRRIQELEKRPIIYLDSTSPTKPSIWVKDLRAGYDVQLFSLKK